MRALREQVIVEKTRCLEMFVKASKGGCGGAEVRF